MKGLVCYAHAALFLTLCFSTLSFSQQENNLNTSGIDSFLLKQNFRKADSTLNAHLTYIQQKHLSDSLYKYPYYVGKIELLKSNATNASESAEKFVNNIRSTVKSPRVHYKALLSLADFYDEIGANAKSLETTKTAHTVVQKVTDATPEEVGKVEYNVGATLLSLGNISEAKSYFQNALHKFESYKKTDKGQLSDGYNAVGATMWMSSKLDSAKYYYTKAIKTIEAADGNPLYNSYLGTVIKSNVSLLEYTQGNLAEAVDIQNEVIKSYENVIKNYNDDNTVSKAKRFQARAISNLAVFYNEQGDLKKANDILVYSYEKKKNIVEANDSSLGSTLIQIGQSQLSLHEYGKAIEHLQSGLKQLNTLADDNPYWKAAGMHALAEAYSYQKNIPLAKKYYEDSERLFKVALNNDYDTEFLSFLRNKALFLANNGEPKQAIHIATNAYKHIDENVGGENFSKLKQLVNLAQIHYDIKEFATALQWVEKANEYLDHASAVADSLQIEFHKPQLILLKAKAEYELQQNKDSLFLKKQLDNLQKATILLEKRKSTVYKNEDVNRIISEYQSLTEFSKKLILVLYAQTEQHEYLKQLMTLHESGMYNRIRSRLNLRNNMSFSNVSDEILQRETALKNAMATSLEDADDMKNFFKVDQEWISFLDSLKHNYPKYYKMRYGTIERSLGTLQKELPEATTLVRYIFIDDDLKAFIITNNGIDLCHLDFDADNTSIQLLNNNHLSISESSELLNQLYQKLWQPFENKIQTKKVVIIPDGVLFNLSFEMLTPSKIVDFSEMTKNSLLAKHVISYNYSLFLIAKQHQTIGYKDNFVAFVPGFDDQMKSNYKISVRDSLHLDKPYLSLLPQPFTKELAKKSARLFNGESFLNEASTKTLFKNSAKEHKIIHIGTHAESNNISPELSRLVFAKSMDSTQMDENYLYTYEIYNTNLSSNLAILTACETGKPTYQSGEGMISLAHAFNYAGSESMLTSLWKIDEQSSASIISLFYNYIDKGWAKDEALRQAKLDYMATAAGRTLHPQYWAGLVLMGDTAPIELSSSPNYLFWAVLVLAALTFIYFLRRKIEAKKLQTF